MCNREEVHAEVMQSELRTNARIDSSHISMAKTISDFGADFGEKIKDLGDSVKDLSSRFEEHDRMEKQDRIALRKHIENSNEMMEKIAKLNPDDLTALKEIAQGYAGFSTVKKLVVGIGAFFIAIGTIVAGVIQIIRSVK